MNSRKGSVLIAVLWCLAILSVLVLGVLHTTRLGLSTAKHQGDSIQAYYLALAGAEKAKALIYQDAASRKKAARNHSGDLYHAPELFREIKLGRGSFSVLRQASPEEGSGLRYGILDEESRLNINLAPIEELLKLEEMLPEIAAAIIDWRDRDDTVSPNGAESEYYASLKPPYLPRNDVIQTARELLQVRGVIKPLLLGEDANSNGILDPEEDENRDGYLNPGWSGALCFDSQVRNSNAAGEARVNVQEADEAALRGVAGVTPELAKAIIAYREQNRLESLADVLDVAAIIPQPNQPPENPGQPGAPPPAPRAQITGPKLISEELFLQIADDIATSSELAQRGPVNLNTASFAVLRCLPAMTDELARAIINYRSSAGFLPNIGHLLSVPGFTKEMLKQLAPRVTVRSETFRIVSEGVIPSTGARRRVELIVRLGRNTIDTISYRENL